MLDNNNLNHLPDSIGLCKRLASLSVAHNKLLELPDSICELSSLSTLTLTGEYCNSNNNPTKTIDLDADTGYYKNLDKTGEIKQTFFLLFDLPTDNKIEVLPADVYRLTGLQKINMASNPIKNPPMSIAETENIDSIGRYLSSAESREGKS